MTPKNNLGLVAWAFRWLGQAYWYGTCVYDCTKSLLTRKAQQYPTHYKDNRMKQYNADISAKKKCSDCVGLIKGYYWTREDGTMKYGLDGRPDKGANGMFQAAKEKGPISTLPEIPGLLLHSPGHVGVYVGEGWAIEARGFAYGIVKTHVSERKWTHWFKCPYIDYADGDGGKMTLPPEAANPATPPVVDDKPTNDGTEVLDFGNRTLKYVKGRRLMTGDDVKAVQARLVALGFTPGTIDGKYGVKTEAAVKAFQLSAGIAGDGIVGPDTHAKLR